MLKPKRKIIREEIKRDPFLETIDKLESSFEKNKKTAINIALGLLVVIFVVNFLFKKQTQKNIDSNSSLGVAMVAFENGDYENAKFQFETIIADFSGTSALNISNFYLGKIHFENNEFGKSEKFLDLFLKAGDPQILCLGAIKMLVDIALNNNKYDKAIKLLDDGSKKVSKNDSIEIKLIKANILIKQGKTDLVKVLIDELEAVEKLPQHLNQEKEIIIGMM